MARNVAAFVPYPASRRILTRCFVDVPPHHPTTLRVLEREGQTLGPDRAAVAELPGLLVGRPYTAHERLRADATARCPPLPRWAPQEALEVR